MYYPLLRARQFDLIAIRELAIENELNGYILPIIEPVRESMNSLKNLQLELANHGCNNIIIANPQIGELLNKHLRILDFYKSELSCKSSIAFRYNPLSNDILHLISKYDLSGCSLICDNNIKIDQTFESIIRSNKISTIIVEKPDSNRQLKSTLLNTGKDIVRLDSQFVKEQRNSDFLPIPENKFTEEHLYYSNDGYAGFADYTVLTSDFIDGGSMPRAVVIHFTYLKQESKEIWIRHFTSETNDSTSNVQGKFFEATKKLLDFCKKNNLRNSAIEEFTGYFEREHYPGLGVVKKLSIKNHLLVVKSSLARKNND